MRIAMTLVVFLAMAATAGAQYQPYQPYNPNPYQAYDPPAYSNPYQQSPSERDREITNQILRDLAGPRDAYEQAVREREERNRHGTNWNNCFYGRGDVLKCPR